MKRTTLAAIALAATASLGLTACAGAAGPAETADAGGKTTLSVSVWNYEGTPSSRRCSTATKQHTLT